MKLLFRRDQRKSMTGKIVFSLTILADVSADERAAIEKYRFGDLMLYAREQLKLDEVSMSGVAKFWMRHALNLTIQVKDLVNGKTIECKDIFEMLAAEDQVRAAAQNFGAILRAAAHFGGDEIVEV